MSRISYVVGAATVLVLALMLTSTPRVSACFVKPCPSDPYIGWLQKDHRLPRPVDQTAHFRVQYGVLKVSDKRFPLHKAQRFVYVFVGGLFTKHWPFYLDANIKPMKKMGLDVRRAPIDSDAAVRANARTLATYITAVAQETGKKVVLIAQSKGAVDASAALAMYPDTHAKVRGFISIQAPFGGSPIAMDVADHDSPLRKIVLEFITKVFKGSEEALTDLQYDKRQEFLYKYPHPQNVPTVAVGTMCSRFSSLLLAPTKYIRDRYGIANDGLVAELDARIPGSVYIKLDNMDHADTVFDINQFSDYRVKEMTLALIMTLFDKTS